MWAESRQPPPSGEVSTEALRSRAKGACWRTLLCAANRPASGGRRSVACKERFFSSTAAMLATGANQRSRISNIEVVFKGHCKAWLKIGWGPSHRSTIQFLAFLQFPPWSYLSSWSFFSIWAWRSSVLAWRARTRSLAASRSSLILSLSASWSRSLWTSLFLISTTVFKESTYSGKVIVKQRFNEGRTAFPTCSTRGKMLERLKQFHFNLLVKSWQD